MCRVPSCDKPTWCRGLCKKHYEESRRLLKSDPDKYHRLVNGGVILAPHAKSRGLAKLAESSG